MNTQPYLFFNGKCEEALEFYKSALGAKVDMVMRFSESPEKPPPGTMPPGSDNKIMHAAFKVGDTQIFASDGHCSGTPSFQGFGLALNAVAQMAFIPSYPFWSLLIIAVDVVALYALCAYGCRD